jgi:fatty-acyl-CoA synthase
LEEITVGQLLQRTTRRFGSRPAVWYGGRTWTYEELERETGRVAAALASIGVKKGCHIALWAEMEPEVLFTYYAIQRMGAVAVMVNTSLKAEEVADLLRRTDVRLLCVGKDLKTGASIAAGCTTRFEEAGVERVLSVGEAPLSGADSIGELCKKVTEADYAKAREMEGQVSPQDTAVMLFTSGSTSAPKAVMSSHYSRVNGGIFQAHDIRATEEDVFCAVTPIFHCFCISVNVMASLASGAQLCILKDRHINTILDAIETCHCTVLSSVPTMFHAMITREGVEKRDLSSLRIGFIGGAFCPPEEFVRIEKALNFTLMSSLGQTECTAGLTVCNIDDSLEVRSKTVGHFMDHVEGCIKDIKTGEILPNGKQGEICVRGYLAMQGYYGQPELTKETIDADGWVHTGDLGSLDDDGNVTLAGRIKELIIRGGENISPCEIETALSQMPQVKDSKVVGIPDDHYGEEICACVVPAPGAQVDVQAVRDFLTQRLAYYKIPKYVLFWDALPTTATGKVSGKLAREKAIAELSR